MNQRSFGVVMALAGVAIAIGSFVHYNSNNDGPSQDERVAQLTCELLADTFQEREECEAVPNWTPNVVVAVVGGVIFLAGVVIASTAQNRGSGRPQWEPPS